MGSCANADLIIVGAGPVGLTVALAVGRCGYQVTLLEARERPARTSRAIGITPASLEIFRRYGLAESLISRGVAVRRAAIHDRNGVPVEASFDQLDSSFPFILSLPQAITEEILTAAVSSTPTVSLLRGEAVDGISLAGEGVTVTTSRGAGYQGRYLAGCDGKRSFVRDSLGLGWRGRELPNSFVMGDFEDRTGYGAVAQLYFTPTGSLESFPLPGGTRRWIAQSRGYHSHPPEGLLEELTRRRSGVDLTSSPELWRSSFRTERRIARQWARPPVFLAGDAAHLMPPIGGQGMNVGIADAEHLADLIIIALENRESLGSLAAEYETRRKRAFAVAAGRSILGMKIGTASGPILAPLRDLLVRSLLASRHEPRLMEHFSMLSSPFRRSPWRQPETLAR